MSYIVNPPGVQQLATSTSYGSTAALMRLRDKHALSSRGLISKIVPDNNKGGYFFNQLQRPAQTLALRSRLISINIINDKIHNPIIFVNKDGILNKESLSKTLARITRQGAFNLMYTCDQCIGKIWANTQLQVLKIEKMLNAATWKYKIVQNG